MGPEHIFIKPGATQCAFNLTSVQVEMRCTLGLPGCQSSSRLRERHFLEKEIRQKVIGKDKRCFPLNSAFVPTHAHMCAPVHVHTCAHTNKNFHNLISSICSKIFFQEKIIRYRLLETAGPINLRSENS